MDTNNLGIVIGRFQVPELHKGHRHLIDTALKQQENVLVLIGSGTSGQPTRKYPLPFKSIETMGKQAYPQVNIIELKDIPASDVEWSNQVDQIILLSNPNIVEAKLYGGRDSFIPYYHGRFETIEVDEVGDISGTEIRNKISKNVPSNKSERMGAIWSIYNRFPVAFQTVDVAIFNKDFSKILLGKKKQDGVSWRFPGGFVDINEAQEETVIRESFEETCIHVELASHIKTFVIKDGRYKGEVDSITSSLYACVYFGELGKAKAGDDLDKVNWFNWEDGLENIMVNSHKEMMTKLLTIY